MVKKIVFVCIVLFPFIVTAQTVRDEMDHGTSDIKWRVFETEGPVTCFTVTGSNLWYSTGNSVGAFNRKTNQKRAYPKLGSVPSAGIMTIANDGKGNVWFGGSEGVIHYSNGNFKSYTTDNGLCDNTVNVIFCSSGSVWVGTENGVSQYRSGSWKNYSTEDGLSGPKVRDICADNEGDVWFATNKGISRYKSGQWKTFNASTGLSWNDAKAITYDARKGELWVAVGEMDVNSYNGKEWNTYMDIQPGIQCIMVDTQSRIWFGSQGGILKYNGFEWVTDPAKIGFPAAVVNDMYRDNVGDLYFALESGVLHMTNPYPY